jgi:pimeloyl-ACP methyl ester carboxylesterase
MEDRSATETMSPSTIQLTVGNRKFSALVAGPDDGPTVLCLHGFPDHHHSFRHQLPVLADAGYRAVAPLLRGYEPSSQGRRHVPDSHPLQVAADVQAWARELGGGEPVHIVGHDWGALVTQATCWLSPELFRSATIFSVPPLHAMDVGIPRHPVQIRNSWYTLFFQLRGLADRIVASRDFAFIERLWRDWSPGWDWDPSDMNALKETFRQPNVLWFALAYYRATLNPFLADSRELRRLTYEPTDVATLTITGELDGCMDTRMYDYIDESLFPRGLRVERIGGAGHFVHQEKPEEVNALLLDWLAAHEQPASE